MKIITRKRLNIAGACVLVALVCTILAQVLRQRDPAYGGKSLTAWLEGLNQPPGSGPHGGEQWGMLYGGWNSGWSREKGQRVQEAMSHMGNSVVPALRRMVRYRESPLRAKLRALQTRQSLIQFKLKSESEIHEEAAAGCFLAEPAIKTQLIQDWIKFLADKETASSPSARTADALQEASFCFFRATINLGPEACTPLLQALTNGGTQLRRSAAGALRQFPSQAEVVVPALLASTLHDPDSVVRYNATLTLSRISTNQVSAILPALRSALLDKDPNVREAATNALKHLAPEAAVNGGVQ